MRKRILCIVLACALLAGIVAVGFVTNEPGITSDGDKGRQVSDYFYIQIYGADDQVVARYKVTLTGTLFAKSREVTSVTFDHEAGDVCETIHKIDGDMVGVVITHPTEGYLMRVFVLDENGEFVEY